MENDDMSVAFQMLKPLCVEVTRTHKPADILQLRDTVVRLTEQQLQEMQTYLLFPLRLNLQQKSRSEEVYLASVECMSAIFSRSIIQQASTWKDIFVAVTMIISSSDSVKLVKSVSEELKFAVVCCIQSIMHSATLSVIQSVYTADFLPLVGHLVALLLYLVDNERSRELRLKSIECLVSLTQQHHYISDLRDQVKSTCTASKRSEGGKEDKNDTDNLKMAFVIGDMFASFLPGITISLCRVSTGPPTQGHKLPVEALRAWSLFVTLTLGDCSIQKDVNVTERINRGSSTLSVSRTPDWVKSTSQKIHVLIERMASIITSDNWRVRLAVVKWAEHLLLHCTSSLKDSVGQLLEILVSSTSDDYAQVASAAKDALNEFSTLKLESHVMIEMLEDGLHILATKLSRVVHSHDEALMLSTLRLLCGYLQLLGVHLQRALLSHSLLQRLLLSLTETLHPARQLTAPLLLHASANSGTVTSPQTPQYPRILYQHFTDDRILQQTHLACQLLGYYGDVSLVVDQALDVFNETSSLKVSASMVINQILLGAAGRVTSLIKKNEIPHNTEILPKVIRYVLTVYLAPENLNVETTPQSGAFQPSGIDSGQTRMLLGGGDAPFISRAGWNPCASLTPEQMRYNVQQVCTLLEGIGTCCLILKEEELSLVIMEIVYPLLEKLSDGSIPVTDAALAALNDLRQACDKSSLADLLHDNADYIVNSVSLRLRHPTQYPLAAGVLRAVLAHCGADILPLISITVQQVLSAVDGAPWQCHHHYILVLRDLVLAIKRWYYEPCIPPTIQDEEPQKVDEDINVDKVDSVEKTFKSFKTKGEDLAKFFVDYHRTKQIASGDIDEEMEEEGPPEEENTVQEDDAKKKPELHQQLVIDVMQRCSHLVSGEEAKQRIVALDTISAGALVLWKHKDLLLPLVHELWPGFSRRLSLYEQDHAVVLKALHTLSVLGETCEDFLHHRVLKDVLPQAAELLKRHSTNSLGVGPAYNHTVACKLQRELLTVIGPLCIQISTGEQKLWNIMYAVKPYLSSRQPLILQKAALSAYRSFMQLELDTVWLLLVNTCSPGELRPPHPSLRKVQVYGSKKRTEYTDNVTILLQET